MFKYLILIFYVATAGAESLPRAERRAVEGVAQSLWPQAPRERINAWGKAQVGGERSAYDPAAFADKVAALVREELEAQARGDSPDLDRLNKTIDVLFDAARTFAGGPADESVRRQRRSLFKWQGLNCAIGLTGSGLCTGILGPAIISTSVWWVGLASVPTLAAIVSSMSMARTSGLPAGAYFEVGRSRAADAHADFIRGLEGRLRDDSSWQHVSPTQTPGSIPRDPGSLLRFVWSPGSMRDACAYWLE